MTSPNPYETRKRSQKVARFVAAFNKVAETAGADPSLPLTAAEILRQLTTATEEQWAKLAKDLGEPKTPSLITQREIIERYATTANRRWATDEEDQRYAVEGDVGCRAYSVKARRDSNGFTWSVYVEGQFLRGGYTRGVDVSEAFAEARALVVETENRKGVA